MRMMRVSRQFLSSSALLLSVLLYFPTTTKASFNYEVERRVFERVDDFMSGPVIAGNLMERFRQNGAFPLDMNVAGRDDFGTLCYSLLNEYKFEFMYYSTEDGIFMGYSDALFGIYREPVSAGYPMDQPDMQKYFHACVDRETGENETCTMAADEDYISCVNNCSLALCEDEETQACDDDSLECAKVQKWCPTYEVIKATNETGPLLGFVPWTFHCHDVHGVFSQEPGAIVIPNEDSDRLGNCLYGDERTLVKRTLAGDYAYCQGTVCDDTFVGGFLSRNYDPRFRPWYLKTKEIQKPNWSPPYPFFDDLDLGITYSQPFYIEDDDRRKIFRGIFSVDYTLQDINDFLVQSYGTDGASSEDDDDEQTYVVIYETAEPNYLIAASTGRSASSKVLESDESVPCPDVAASNSASTTGCIVKRVEMVNMTGQPHDDVLRTSFLRQEDLGYPRNLVSTSLSEDGEAGGQVYVSQSSIYSDEAGSLNWTILVISTLERSENDSLTTDDNLFFIVCVVSGLGFLLCSVMSVLFYLKRKSRAVILADWLFTTLFLMGCALLNLSSFVFLGENTDVLCVARLWSFHLLFAMALSPLFVKVYRMYRLIGSQNQTPAVITNPQAIMLTLPIIVIQVAILTVFTILDPPRPEDIIVIEDSVVTHSVECTNDNEIFTYVVYAFSCGIVFLGCLLAFVTRNVDAAFGQSKELIFAMYNVAFVGLLISILRFFLDIEIAGQIALYSVGIFCGTVFSSAAFVLPRLIQTHHGGGVVLQRRSRGSHDKSNSKAASKTSKSSDGKNKPKRVSHVNFSEDVDIVGERPETGWSVFDKENGEEADVASGLKRASSFNSLQDDDVWTRADASSVANGAAATGTKTSNHTGTETSTKADETTTWNLSDLPSTLPSTPPSKPPKNAAATTSPSRSSATKKSSSQRSSSSRPHSYHREEVTPSAIISTRHV